MQSFDNSSTSQYQKCPMSYYLQYVCGLKKIDQDESQARMDFGSAYHTFLENVLQKQDTKSQETRDLYESPKDLPQYSKEALILLTNTYFEKYADIDSQFKVLEVEDVSELDLDSNTFKVKKDGAVEMNGNIYALEHKTTGSIGQYYFDKYYLNSQISAQCYDVKNKYGQCQGVILNVAEIKFLKRKPRAAYEGVMPFKGGYLVCKFDREYYNRTTTELKDWKENTIGWINQIKQSIENNSWLKSTGSWGGGICNMCEYRELCKFSKGTELDETVKQMSYKEVDPYAYLKPEGGSK